MNIYRFFDVFGELTIPIYALVLFIVYYYELKLTDSTFDGPEADGDYFDGNIFQQYLADNFGKPSYIIAEDYNTMVEPDIRSRDHIKWEGE